MWIQYALLSGFILGTRTIIARLSQNLGLNAADGVAYQSLSLAVVSFIVYAVFVLFGYGKLTVNNPGVSSAIFVGVLNGVAVITIFLSVKDGFATLATVLFYAVSLLITTVCSPVLGDILGLKHYVAVAFAILAAVLAI